ncbi:FhaA domain-containing protein [Nesterenkonia halotolerans]|uniref:FhaA domain-containing protein n=1 Tax=Nesterenkonia halotolerans TaxID=225325 RepID=UPI003EE5A2DC
MGLLDNLERGIEKAVRGAFSGRGGSLGPVEIATAVRRHMDRESKTVAEGHSLAPNLYKIRLAEEDFAEAKKYGVTLAEELCEEILRHAESQGYTLLGPVRATFVKNTELKRGQLSIESRTDKDAQSSPVAPQASSPAAGPSAGAPLPSTMAQPTVPSRPAPAPAPAPERAASLEYEERTYPLRPDSTVIGRSTSADVTVPDTGVSRKHVELFRTAGNWYARDLGSTNGSYVDGEQLTGDHSKVQLTDGALISLGNARLRFRLS